jgi:glycosyltransferase involved in cell wall biosynthesis
LPHLQQRGIEAELLLLAGPEDEQAALLARAGIKVHHSRQRWLYSPLQVLAIARLLRSVDIVHAHLFPSFFWVALAVGLRRNIHAVYTEHSTTNRRREYGLLGLADMLAYRKYSRIICISEGVKKQLDHYLPAAAAKSVVVYNGIDLREFTNRQAEKSVRGDASQPLVVCVANLIDYKGQDVLIRSLALLPEEVHVALAGRGPQEARLRELAASLGVTGRVRFLGYVSDVASVYNAARICVIPSLWEGFGMVAVEAMASGVPVVASRIPGLAEVVGIAGLLFEAGNPADLAEKISILLKSPALWSEKRKLGIERSKTFSIERMADEYCRVYAETHG